jgi:hypothetical protein
MVRARHGLTETMLNGWRALTLTSDKLEVTVLPDKGADIYALADLESGIDPLFKAPWGLQPPGSPPREGSAGEKFLENYEGSWQELFPNTNDACTCRESRHRPRLPAQLGEAVFVTPGGHDVRALQRAAPGDRPPDPGRGARDQHDPMVKPSHERHSV